jgi:hypothetical protein
MASRSLGKVTVSSSGTPVQTTTTRAGLQSITFQVSPGNTGVAYIGLAGMSVSGGTGILAVLPAPTSATTGPFSSVTFSEPLAPAGLNAADFWVDSTHAADFVFVSGTEQ